MVYTLTLTRKYQIIERRVDDEDLANELTDDATLKVFDALEKMDLLPVSGGSEDVDDLHYEDNYYILSDDQLATLKENVNLEGFEIYANEED